MWWANCCRRVKAKSKRELRASGKRVADALVDKAGDMAVRIVVKHFNMYSGAAQENTHCPGRQASQTAALAGRRRNAVGGGIEQDVEQVCENVMREIAARIAPAIERQADKLVEDVARQHLGEKDPPRAKGTVADGDRAIAQIRMQSFIRGTIRASRRMAEDIGDVVADEGLAQLVNSMAERLQSDGEEVRVYELCSEWTPTSVRLCARVNILAWT